MNTRRDLDPDQPPVDPAEGPHAPSTLTHDLAAGQTGTILGIWIPARRGATDLVVVLDVTGDEVDIYADAVALLPAALKVPQ